jgi:hypothetical protein
VFSSFSRSSFEPAIPVFERFKIVHALDRVYTVINNSNNDNNNNVVGEIS